MATTPTSAASTAAASAKAPYNETLVRLGRSVWFTLETLHRSDPNRIEAMDKLVSNDDNKNLKDWVKSSGMLWLTNEGDDITKRRQWNNNQWLNFITTSNLWTCLFHSRHDENSASADEKQLKELFESYLTFYTNLPEGDGETTNNMDIIQVKVDALLNKFELKYGDPLVVCDSCNKCAIGKKLQKCTRCRNVYYCNKTCQVSAWKNHKKTCRDIKKLNSKQLDMLVRKRYHYLRQYKGKSSSIAMKLAREVYYGKEDVNASGGRNDAGSKVAAMFGMQL